MFVLHAGYCAFKFLFQSSHLDTEKKSLNNNNLVQLVSLKSLKVTCIVKLSII